MEQTMLLKALATLAKELVFQARHAYSPHSNLQKALDAMENFLKENRL